MSLPRPSRKIAEEAETKSESRAAKINPNAFRPSDVFAFEPKPDMTPYELAVLIKLLYEPAVHFKSFLGLPEQLQRHFRPTKA